MVVAIEIAQHVAALDDVACLNETAKFLLRRHRSDLMQLASSPAPSHDGDDDPSSSASVSTTPPMPISSTCSSSQTTATTASSPHSSCSPSRTYFAINDVMIAPPPPASTPTTISIKATSTGSHRRTRTVPTTFMPLPPAPAPAPAPALSPLAAAPSSSLRTTATATSSSTSSLQSLAIQIPSSSRSSSPCESLDSSSCGTSPRRDQLFHFANYSLRIQPLADSTYELLQGTAVLSALERFEQARRELEHELAAAQLWFQFLKVQMLLRPCSRSRPFVATHQWLMRQSCC
jgi:hypothetical protein